MKESCENCNFYLKDFSTEKGGNCRRYPPVLIPLFHDSDAFSATPSVRKDSWCGEYKKAGNIK